MNSDQEQTWPTTEELENAQAQQTQLKKHVPKGTSEYQAAWILSDDEEKYSENDELDDDQQDMITTNADDLESIQFDKEEEEMDEIVINKNNYDEKFDLEEDKQTFVKHKFLIKKKFNFFLV